jgi:leucyl aminopeptidase
MKFHSKVTQSTKVEADLLAVFAGSEEAKKVDTALGGMLFQLARDEGFEESKENQFLLHTHGKIAAKRVLLVGLGKSDKPTPSHIQMVMASIGRKAREVGAKTLAVSLPKELSSQTAVEGLILGTYAFTKHKSRSAKDKEKHIEDVLILTTPPRLDAVAAGIGRGEVASRAVVSARDLINESPSTTTPAYLADTAKKLAKSNDLITCEVFGPNELRQFGMEALLGISRGSDEEPRFIRLSYSGGGNKTVCLVGKGITFDTGGLSLKDAKNMETMKLDMAGAAAILGVFSVLPVLKPKVNVVGLIASCENMPGSKAIKPGDVVRAMNGKTIEILDTDAEGRVVLADALSYAGAKLNADTIIDLATLTGACMVALGEEVAGMFTDDEALGRQLKSAAYASGEHVWELPLVPQYKDELKSDIADVKNIAHTRYGGAINGALFLAEFAPGGVPWAHLDIAGPAWAEKDAPLTPKGGTGFGVRMILEFLETYSR